jgi:DNA-binding MarR family transcriptional regulator
MRLPQIDADGSPEPFPAPLDHADLRPILGLILNADRRLRGELDRVLEEFPVSTAEYTALIILRRSGPLTSAGLARRVYVTPQAMGQLVAGLEGKRLVQRHADPAHARRLLVELTAAGIDLLEKCGPSIASIEDAFLAGLNPREALYFHQLLQVCVDQMNAGRTPGTLDDGDESALAPE